MSDISDPDRHSTAEGPHPPERGAGESRSPEYRPGPSAVSTLVNSSSNDGPRCIESLPEG
jgi:hypothetical protein